MPILGLQRSLRRLGKIRIGDQQETASGKKRPAKLDTFRLTSPSRESLDGAAALFGGEVQEWEGAPGEGRQFELYTGKDTLDIVLPPGPHPDSGINDSAFMQFNELWSAGGCQRRCDGQTDWISGSPCMCPADIEERAAAATKGKACKMTTRLSVILPRVPDIGTWMLETHGYYAAVELGGFIDLVRRSAPGSIVEAQLRIDHRTAKRNNETRNYIVPVIELPGASPAALMAGTPAPLAIDAAPAAQMSEGGVAGRVTSEVEPVSPDGRVTPAATSAPPRPASSATVEPSEPADEWDRISLGNRFEKLDDEWRKVAWERWKAAEPPLPPPQHPDLDKVHVDRACALLFAVEEEAKETYDRRRKRANAAMSAVGVKSDDARHDLVRQATEGRTDSTRCLASVDVEAIAKFCADLAAQDGDDPGRPF